MVIFSMALVIWYLSQIEKQNYQVFSNKYQLLHNLQSIKQGFMKLRDGVLILKESESEKLEAIFSNNYFYDFFSINPNTNSKSDMIYPSSHYHDNGN